MTTQAQAKAKAPIPFYVPLAVTALVGVLPGYALLLLNGHRLNCTRYNRSVVLLAATAALVMSLHLLRGIIGLDVIAERLGQDPTLTFGITRSLMTSVGLAGALLVTTLQVDAIRFATIHHRISAGRLPIIWPILALLLYLFVILVFSNSWTDPISDAFFFLMSVYTG